MTLNKNHGTDGSKYAVTGDIKSKAVNLRTIDDMSSTAIIRHMLHKHRYGLWVLYGVLLTAWVIYDKVLSIFIHGV